MKCTTQPWTVSALYVKQKVIETDPPYQRESGIWSVEKKQLFIDSIMNGFDVPKLYFHDIRSEGEPVSFNVIDGKQRLGAIWEFLDKSKGFSLADDFTFSGDVSWFEEEGHRHQGENFPSYRISNKSISDCRPSMWSKWQVRTRKILRSCSPA